MRWKLSGRMKERCSLNLSNVRVESGVLGTLSMDTFL